MNFIVNVIQLFTNETYFFALKEAYICLLLIGKETRQRDAYQHFRTIGNEIIWRQFGIL